MHAWSRRSALRVALAAGAGAVAGCSTPASPAQPTPSQQGTAPPLTPPAQAAGPSVAGPTAAPAVLPPVRHEPSLPALMGRTYAGRAPERLRTMATTAAYTKYAVRYPSGQLTVSGVLYVPSDPGPSSGIVLNHGYIEPSRYRTGQGMAPEQEFLAERGFVVLHTDYRGHATSSPAGPTDHELRLGYAEDALHAAAALRAMPEVDAGRVAMFGRSMGGGVTLNALVIAPELVRAAVVWASVSSAFVDNVRQFTARFRPETVAALESRFGALTGENTFYADLSSRSFFDRIRVPVLIEHGTADETCPIEWSRQSHALMQESGVDVQLTERPGEGHAYARLWTRAMEETYAFLRRQLTA